MLKWRSIMRDYKKDMGRRLQFYRKNLHLTQEQIAEKLDISVKHYSELERGLTGISVDGLISISDILGVNIDYLLKGSDYTSSIPDELIDLLNSMTDVQKQKVIDLIKLISDF